MTHHQVLVSIITATTAAGTLATAQETEYPNWFLQAGAGIDTPIMEGFQFNQTHVGATYNLGIGGWFTPDLGFRFSGYYNHYIENLNDGTLHFNSATLNADLLWDMTTTISGVNPDRIFTVIEYIGVGGAYVHNFSGKTNHINVTNDGSPRINSWMLPVSIGTMFKFRLNRYCSFMLDSRTSFAGDNYNNIVGGRPIDITSQVTAGIIWYINWTSTQVNNSESDIAYLNDLNDQINELRAELDATSAALAIAEEQLPCPEQIHQIQQITITTPTLLSTVRFTIDSDKVTDEEMVNIYNLAEYMKQNPEVNVTITGYADKATGAAEYNQHLSARRAQTVFNILTQSYGISPTRLSQTSHGSAHQPYPTNNWNRIVTFTANPQ